MVREVAQVEWVYKSDVGRVRSHNEDSMFIHAPDEELVAVVVADGMGGHKAGDVASQLAAKVMEEQLVQIKAEHTLDELKTILVESVQLANERILQKSRENASMSGMGTTLVVAIIKGQHLLIGNIGDSRAYLMNDEKCEQLTQDHSFVNELLHMGEITEKEAMAHPQKNVIVRAVGIDDEVKPDVTVHTWAENDYLLVCTDGLTDMVSDEEIHSVIKKEDQMERKADQLIQLALDAGGVDNISLALVKRTGMSSSRTGSAQEAR